MKAYMCHAGEPVDGAVLAFAHSHREARKVAFLSVNNWTGCEYIDVKAQWLKHDYWLKANAANPEKLAAGAPHVIDNPPACKGCELWFDELEGSGYCETCAEEREEDHDGS